MTYNWKCCSLYPNNFGASALKSNASALSTGLWTCFYWPVYMFPQASGNTYTAMWTTTNRARLIGCFVAIYCF